MTKPLPPHAAQARLHIGAATASTNDLLDLLTPGLAEDARRRSPLECPACTMFRVWSLTAVHPRPERGRR